MSPIERSASGGGGGFTNPMTTAGDIIIENAVPAAARLAVGTSGQVLGISGGLPAWVTPPGFEINYTQITAAVLIVSTNEAAGTTVLSPGAITFDGSPVLVTFGSSNITTPNTTTGLLAVSLFEGATQITELLTARGGVSPSGIQPVTAMYRFTPTAASHTYTITAFVSIVSGSPAVGAGPGGTGQASPAFVRFTKV